MIKSFKHKGLNIFFTTGSMAGINPNHAARLEERLQALHTAMSIEDMDIPGWRLHQLKGDRTGLWAKDALQNNLIILKRWRTMPP